MVSRPVAFTSGRCRQRLSRWRSGNDRIIGDTGDDTVKARDGEADRIDCGPGTDTVFYDEGIDQVVKFENLNPEGSVDGLDDRSVILWSPRPEGRGDLRRVLAVLTFLRS